VIKELEQVVLAPAWDIGQDTSRSSEYQVRRLIVSQADSPDHLTHSSVDHHLGPEATDHAGGNALHYKNRREPGQQNYSTVIVPWAATAQS